MMVVVMKTMRMMMMVVKIMRLMMRMMRMMKMMRQVCEERKMLKEGTCVEKQKQTNNEQHFAEYH